jgi:predicted Zn-dependent peptidase
MNPTSSLRSASGLAFLCLFLSLLLAAPHSQSASTATRRLLEASISTLPNGLLVIHRQHEASDTFTLHLVVDLGLADFPCEQQQIPHLLEHMLFEDADTDQQSLRKRLQDHGGQWHGYTLPEYTHFTLSVHSAYPEVAFETLATMLKHIQFRPSSFERAVRVIESELGIARSPIKRWLAGKKSVKEQAKAKLYPQSHLDCEYQSQPDAVTLEQTKAAFDAHYHTGNMTLMLIGAFEPHKTHALLSQHFHDLPAGTAKTVAALPPPPQTYEPLTVYSHFLDSEVHLNLMLRAVGSGHPDSTALKLIAQYLDEQLYYRIRMQHGLGYTPSARLDTGTRYGEMVLHTATHADWHDRALELLKGIYEEVRQQGMPPAELERLKRREILTFEAKERDHQEIAQLYRHQIDGIRSTGRLRDPVAEIESIDAEAVHAAIQTYFPKTPLIAVLRPPSGAETFLRILGVILISSVLAFPLWRRIRRPSSPAR